MEPESNSKENVFEDNNNQVKLFFKIKNNASNTQFRTSVGKHNLSITSIGQGFRKSIRRISDYYIANNKIVAQHVKKGDPNASSDSISFNGSENSELSV